MMENTFEIKDFSYLIGKNYEIAKKELAEPYYLMPITIDGNSFMWTHDVNMYRVGVVIENNIITEVKGQG